MAHKKILATKANEAGDVHDKGPGCGPAAAMGSDVARPYSWFPERTAHLLNPPFAEPSNKVSKTHSPAVSLNLKWEGAWDAQAAVMSNPL